MMNIIYMMIYNHEDNDDYADDNDDYDDYDNVAYEEGCVADINDDYVIVADVDDDNDQENDDEYNIYDFLLS